MAAFEANATAARLAELDAAPLEGRFDDVHLTAIHKYIFQDVYSWAGEFRTVNISKGGQHFGVAAFIEPELKQAGFAIDWSRITQDRMTAASRESFATGESHGLGHCVYSCLVGL